MLDQLGNPWWVFVILGVCAGLLSGLLGIGGGVILVPTLVIIMGFAQKSAQGMSLAIMVPLVLVGAIRYWRNGDIEMDAIVIGLIVCGSIAGTLLGSELALRIPAHVLRKLFAVFMVVVAVRMFIGSSKPPAAAGDNGANQNKVSTVESGGSD